MAGSAVLSGVGKALKFSGVAATRAAAEAGSDVPAAVGKNVAGSVLLGAGDAGFTGGATGGAGFEDDQTARAAGARPDEDVVEADYEIVDDEKK